MVFSHILPQLMLHQPYGEKAAIFIHICSRPTTIFAEKTETKGDFVIWLKSKKESKSASRTLAKW